MKRLLAALIAAALLLASCADAPDPGDLAAFCSLLESGSGLSSSPTSEDLERLVLVAPPAVRPTIEALQNRARDFGDLLAVEPPDLEALFNARFDPEARREQAELDTYAENSCGIAIDRPPATRWNNFVRENYGDAAWVELITAQFDVAADRIDSASVVFAQAPEPISLVEQVCTAVSEFLVADGANPGGVRVFIDAVVALEQDTPEGSCRLP